MSSRQWVSIAGYGSTSPPMSDQSFRVPLECSGVVHGISPPVWFLDERRPQTDTSERPGTGQWNEWRKFRVVSRSHSLRALVSYLA